MTLNIASSTGTTSTQAVFDQMRQRMQTVNNAAANYLGMSAQDLRTQLNSGKSLSDIATAQGKSVDGLKSAISTALKSADPTISDPTAMVDRLVTKTHGGHHHGGVGKAGGGTDSDGDNDGNTVNSTNSTVGGTASPTPPIIDPVLQAQSQAGQNLISVL